MPTGNRNYPTLATTDDPNIPEDINNLASAIDADMEAIARIRRFKVRRSVSTNLTTSTWTKVLYDQIDTGYTNPSGALTPAPADFVFPAGWGGRWDIYLRAKFAPGSAGARAITIRKNGTNVVGGAPTGTELEFGDHHVRAMETNGGLPTTSQIYIPDEVFVAGDKLQVYTWQNSGGTIGFTYALQGKLVRTS